MKLGVCVVALFLANHPAWSQTPVISSITDFRGNPVTCPSCVAQVFGAWPVDAARNWTVTAGGIPGIVSASWIVSGTAVELDIVIPAEVPVGTANVIVSHLGTPSNAFPISVVAVDPLLGFGAYSTFLHSSGVYITAALPASPGETASTFMNGLGITNPFTSSATSITSFTNTAQTATVTVAGQPATVQFAGLFPGGVTGSYQVSFVVPSSTPAGPQPVSVTIGDVTSNTQTLFVGPQILTGQPVISAVANGASFSTKTNISPGSFISIFTSGLAGPDNLSAFPNTTVNGISVTVNGKLAPIFALAAAAGQINALVPTDADIGASLNIVVQNQNGPSKPYTVFGGAAGAGVFLIPDPGNSTRTNAAATLANSSWLVIPASQAKALGVPPCTGLAATAACGQPAHPGDFIQLYATGLGPATVNGAANGTLLATGQVAPVSGNPIYANVVTPTVTVGGIAAKVIFSGLALPITRKVCRTNLI